MVVVVNGVQHELPGALTLRELIERLGLSGSACAAEVNKVLVPRQEHAARVLRAGDVVELVSLVGGG